MREMFLIHLLTDMPTTRDAIASKNHEKQSGKTVEWGSGLL